MTIHEKGHFFVVLLFSRSTSLSRDEIRVIAALPQLHGQIHEARAVLRPFALQEEGGVLLVDRSVVLLLNLR